MYDDIAASWLAGLQALQLGADFSSCIGDLQALIARAGCAARGAPERSGAPAELQADFRRQVERVGRAMGGLSRISRQQCETYLAAMLGDAAAAGLDVRCWRA